jgi:hypothetical protein
MKKSLRYIVCLLAVVPMLQGCFKDVVNYTDYRICVYDQSQSNGEFIHSPELESYAFYVDTTEWTVKSYEDAVARRITNKLTGETKTTPDAEGTFAAEEEYQVTVRLESEISMLVIVNPTLQLYAYRKYKLPENLPVVDTKLYMASWRPTHPASGWLIKNEFYVPPTNEPTTPPADDNEGNDDNEGDEDDNGEGGDDGDGEDGEDNPPADDGDGDTPTEGDGDTPTEDDNNDENQKK